VSRASAAQSKPFHAPTLRVQGQPEQRQDAPPILFSSVSILEAKATRAASSVAVQARDLSSQFEAGLETLIELGQSRRVAMMCSEAVYWRCHRRIITDHLLLSGIDVVHLMGHGREDPATPTPGAIRTPEGKVVYPAESPTH
jgi:hypothetical protein